MDIVILKIFVYNGPLHKLNDIQSTQVLGLNNYILETPREFLGVISKRLNMLN